MVEERVPKPRGRAAAEIRTGLFIRDWLEKVGEDSLIGIHGALKSKIGRFNMLRPKAKWLRAPTYESFLKYFGHIRRWGLVEFVRDEPTEYVHEKLVSIRMAGPWPDARPLPPMNVVTTTRRIYRLSALGRRPEMQFLWEDPLVQSLFRAIMAGAVPKPS
ncbi:MAG: hypothetical protein HWN68_19465 [Desulfobacterales bacterium]|nr:hypothetical protein [Desulfobacterales bacterium]